jgi:CubicO group peptidase (beta-lactamase class C family)
MLLIALTLLLQPVSGSNADLVRAVDSQVRAEMKRQNIAGCAVMVTKQGKVLHSKGYGKANLEWNLDAKPNTIFKIGSISKPVLALAVMRLVEEGKFEIESPIGQVLPGAPESWNAIRIRHLLNHTSGLPRELPGWSPTRAFDEPTLRTMAFQLKPDFEPGTQHRYCNSGYFLLASIIQQVTGGPWENWVEKEVFQRAGMKHSRTTAYTAIVPNRASGYQWKDNRWINDSHIESVRPSGAFLSSIDDLGRFDLALRAGKIVKPQTFERMIEPTRLSDGSEVPYGLGFITTTTTQGKVYGHNGAITGFRSGYLRWVDRDVSVALLTNEGSCDPDTMLQKIAEAVLPK